MHNGAPAHFIHAAQDVLSNTYHDRWIGRGGHTVWPPRSPDLNALDFYLWGHLNTLVYAAPVDNEETLHHRIVDACQTIRNYPRIFERMRRSTMRRVEARTESHGLFSDITHKIHVSEHMLFGKFSLVWYVELVPKLRPYLSVYLYILINLKIFQ
jgi:hypothetical protein